MRVRVGVSESVSVSEVRVSVRESESVRECEGV